MDWEHIEKATCVNLSGERWIIEAERRLFAVERMTDDNFFITSFYFFGVKVEIIFSPCQFLL
jgi:hypothetical protein